MTAAVCSVEGCEDPVRGRGMCTSHYNAWTKRRDPVSSARRWPVHDLLVASGRSVDELALIVGVHPSTVARKASGISMLTDDQADTWACRCGMNPAEVWGEAWWMPWSDGELGAAVAS